MADETVTPELLAAWTATRIRLDDDPAVTLTGPDAIEPWPFEDRMVVLTAANPGSRRLPSTVNDARNAELVAALAGHDVLAVTAGLDDWEESSLAILGLDDELAQSLAARFGQLGWFVLSGDQVQVRETATGDVLDSRPRRHE